MSKDLNWATKVKLIWFTEHKAKGFETIINFNFPFIVIIDHMEIWSVWWNKMSILPIWSARTYEDH